MKKKHLLLAMVLPVLCVAAFGPTANAEIGPAAEFLPPDTIGYISLGSEGLKAALEGTALAAILREEEVQALLSPIKKKMGIEGELSLAKLPIPEQIREVIQQVESVLSGPMVIAMTGIPTDLVSVSGPEELYTGLVAIADVRGNEEKAEQLIDDLNKSVAEKFGAAAQPPAEAEGQREFRGNRNLSGILAGAVGLPLKYRTKDGYLITSTSQATVDKVASLMDDPAAPTLADKPRFKAVSSRIATPKNLYTVYIDLNMPMMLLEGMLLQNLPMAKAGYEVFGLTSIEAAGLSIGIDGGGFKDALYVYAPGARTGLIHTALTGQGLALSDLKNIPEDALFFLALNIDPSASLRAFQDALDEGDRFSEFLEELHEELGFSLENELLPAVETPLVVYAKVPVGGLIPEVVAVLKLRDAAKFRQCLDTLFSKAPEGEISVQEFKGNKIYVATTNGPVSPSFGVSGDYAVAALFPHTLKSAMARLESPGASVADSPAFQPALDRLSPETRLALVLDMKKIFNFGYGAALPFLTMAGPEMNRGGIPLDLSALPMAETISKHLFAQYFAIAREKDGIAVDSYGLLPQGVLPAAFAGIRAKDGAARRASMAERRAEEMRQTRAAQESLSPDQMLEMIAKAEGRFKLQLAADADVDGVGEYGAIDALLQNGLLGHWVPSIPSQRAGLFYIGYIFRVYVPKEADNAEQVFAAYAWPENPGGGAAYFIDQDGVVHRTLMDTTPYAGPEGGPAADAAYTGEAFFSDIALGKATPGNDGNVWRPVERPREATEERAEGDAQGAN
jgi:hypothetical protein